jgi:phospholipase C
VVIFQENVSFDHYFGTYPNATNASGQHFRAAKDTPKANTLAAAKGVGGKGTLLTNNPNLDANGAQVNPSRYDPANIKDVLTCDQDHVYADEQKAFDGGKMSGDTGGVGLTINDANTDGDTVPDGKGGMSLISDAQPYYDDCSTSDAASLTGKNVGDNLNAAGLGWGWFQGGFRPTTTFAAATTGKTQPTSTFIADQFKGKFAAAPASDQGLCNAVHPVGAAAGGTGGTAPGATNFGSKDDYIAHHEPFQYYASTANPHHRPPAALNAIGTDTQTTVNGTPQFDTANRQYDTSDFDALVAGISRGYVSPDRLPAVSFLKAPGYQNGHAGYSDPFDEQQFIANEINALQHTPDWANTAVVISYDDSDGWYDHAFSGVHNASNTAAVATPPGPQDFLTGTGRCGDTSKLTPLAGQNGRCGYGPRLPLLLVSPWAKRNFVDHTVTDQSSILKFIEDNWRLPRISGSFDSIAGSLNTMFDFSRRGRLSPARPRGPARIPPPPGSPTSAA